MTPGWQYRFAVLSRIVAGFGGGYVLTSLFIAFLSLCLPGSKASAVLFATMPAFLIYALIIMAVFHARNMVRAWVWIASASTLLVLLILLMTQNGMR